MKSKFEINFIHPEFEIRADAGDGDELQLTGYAAVFDKEVKLFERYREVIRRVAFKETLKNDDQVFLKGHQDHIVLGRKSAGTLTLAVDDHGLLFGAKLDGRNSDARNAFYEVERGDVNRMSFGFSIEDMKPILEDGEIVGREIRKVKLYEISTVAFPAYPTTEVGVRGLIAEKEKRSFVFSPRRFLKCGGIGETELEFRIWLKNKRKNAAKWAKESNNVS